MKKRSKATQKAKWRPHYRGGGRHVGAEAVMAAIVQLEDDEGGVTPSSLVDAARPPTAAIHDAFTWDDTKAAEQFRVVEARQMISGLMIVQVVGEEEKEIGPAYVSVRIRKDEDEMEHRYMQLAVVQRNQDLSDQVVAEAKAGLRAWRRRYESLSEILSPAFDGIQKVLGE